MLTEKPIARPDRNGGGFVGWIAVDTRADRRKGDVATIVFDGKFKTASVNAR